MAAKGELVGGATYSVKVPAEMHQRLKELRKMAIDDDALLFSNLLREMLEYGLARIERRLDGQGLE